MASSVQQHDLAHGDIDTNHVAAADEHVDVNGTNNCDDDEITLGNLRPVAKAASIPDEVLHGGGGRIVDKEAQALMYQFYRMTAVLMGVPFFYCVLVSLLRGLGPMCYFSHTDLLQVLHDYDEAGRTRTKTTFLILFSILSLLVLRSYTSLLVLQRTCR